MSIFVPFNHQPATSAIKTSSYSVATGYYARVTPFDFAADFTIGGSIVYYQNEYSGSFDVDLGGAIGTKFTNDTNIILVGNLYVSTITTTMTVQVEQNGNSGITCVSPLTGNTMVVTGAGGVSDLYLNPGDTIELVVKGSNAVVNLAYYNLRALNEHPQREFWVPSGTSLNGSGYLVEEYPELT